MALADDIYAAYYEANKVGDLPDSDAKQIMDEHFRDLATRLAAALGGFSGGSSSIARRSLTGGAVSVGVTPGVDAAWIPWPAENIQVGTDVVIDGGNNTRYNIVTDGVYEVGGFFTIYEGGTAQRSQCTVGIYVNGSLATSYRSTSYIRNAGGLDWRWWVLELSPTPLSLSAGDYVQFAVTTHTGNTFTPSAVAGESAQVQASSRTSSWIKKIG